jgi:chemotaxis protein methyltransferase CheR
VNPAPPQVLAILRMLIEERTGIRYSDADAALIEDKVVSRADVAGFDSLLDYYYYLRYDPNSGAEFNELTDALVVNETYFFREVLGLEVAIEEVLKPAIEKRGRARAWSAACSTGEEPFSLAMMLAERGLLEHTEIVATDISRRALALAQSGRFRPRSVRTDVLPSAASGRLTLQDGRAQLAPLIQNAVDFRWLNLMDHEAIAKLGTFDLILCRNVLIYFSDQVVARLLTELSCALATGGALVVGTCESLLRYSTSLVCEERRGAFIYRSARND